MNRIEKTLAAVMAAGTFLGASAYTTEPSESLEVWIGDGIIENDGTSIATLTVYEKDNVDYTAFNMAIVVPEGITVAKVKQGREWVDDIHLTDRASATHNITCNMPDSNTIKIISSSPSLSPYYPTTEDGVDPYALFTIGLVASPTLAPGDYKLELCDVKFVLESGDAFVLPEEPLTFTLKVEGDPVGINEIDSDEREETLYDLQGRPLKEVSGEEIVIRNGQKIIRKR
ncbi:MAG: hypothetical protein HDS26_01905 [Bacteroides sp.]|nr:hypothetical protein [Bacteroides sp.]